MFRPLRPAPYVLTLALLAVACGDDDPVPTAPTLTEIEVEFTDTVTVNGARIHQFTVDNSGDVQAQLTQVSVEGATLGLALGTWNGASCQLIIASTNAVQGTTVLGRASAGQFCAYVHDVGHLTTPVEYTIRIRHF